MVVFQKGKEEKEERLDNCLYLLKTALHWDGDIASQGLCLRKDGGNPNLRLNFSYK